MLFSLTCVKRNKEFGACMQMCRNVIKAVLKKTAKKQQWHEQQPKKSLQTIKGDSNWYLCNVITSWCLCDTLCQFCRVFESRLYTLVLLDLVIKWTFLYKRGKSFCNFMCVRETDRECHQCQVTRPPSAALWLSWSLHEWMGHPAPASHPLGDSWPVKTPAQCVGHWRYLRNALTSAGGWLPCLSTGYFHKKSVEGLGPDVRVHRLPSVPRRRCACHPCQHTLCPLCKSCPPIILHGPKLSLECTAGNLVCSLIIRFCKQILWQGYFFSSSSWFFFISFVQPVLLFSGQQANNFSCGFLIK